VVGDFNAFGRVYMSTVGRGLIFGEPAGSHVVVSRAPESFQSLRRDGAILSARTEIVLSDLRGRTLRRSVAFQGGARLALSGLPRGVYLARSGFDALRVDVMR
jgi:hypothetical protein